MLAWGEKPACVTVFNSGACMHEGLPWELDLQSSASKEPMILKRVYMRKVKKTSMRAIVTHATDLTKGVRVSASIKLGITPAGGVRAGTWLGSKEDKFIVGEDRRARHTEAPNRRCCFLGIDGSGQVWCLIVFNKVKFGKRNEVRSFRTSVYVTGAWFYAWGTTLKTQIGHDVSTRDPAAYVYAFAFTTI